MFVRPEGHHRRLGWRMLALMLGLAGVARSAAAQDDDPLRREGFFYQQRAFPADRIPAHALGDALAQMYARWPQTRAGRAGSPFASLVNTSSAWSSIGPAPISTGVTGSETAGRINSIAIDPKNSQTLYIGAATGGVWKSTNGGASWTPLTDNECGLAMGSVAIDPVNPQILYAGTGEENFSSDSYQGCGVLRSTNGGTTWTQLGATTFVTASGTASRIAKVVIDFASAGSTSSTILLVASQTGLWKSDNSGSTWTLSLAGIITDLVADPTTAGTYTAAIGSVNGGTANGIYRSTDFGVSWNKLSGGLPTSSVGRIALGMSPTTPNIMYASVQTTSSNTLLGIWKTLDGGTSWNKLTATNASCSSQCWYDMALAVDPAQPDHVVFGGISLYHSTDGGTTFRTMGSGVVHVDHHVFVFDPTTPTTMYSGNDGGIFRSTDGGATWVSLNTNLALTQFYPGISVHPTDASIIVGGAQDNGTMQWNGSSKWPTLFGGDGGFTAVNHRTGGSTFVTCQWPTCVPLRRDGAGTFLTKGTGLNSGDRGAFIPPMVMDPVNPTVLYFGTYRLYRTSNSGDLWTPISGDLTNGTGTIRTIAVAPSDTTTVYVGASDGAVQVTTDLGATWTNISAGLPLKSVTYIAVDPRDPRTAYVTVSGFGTGHVWKTTNRGASWTDISFDLPNVPVNTIVLQKGSRELDIGTDIGVFALPDGVTSWQPLAAGLPNTVIHDLVYDGPRGRLVAATHGRGMFTLAVAPAVLRGNVTGSGTLSALDAQAILSSVVGLPLPTGAKRFPNGDANCDGDVTAVDALVVLSKLVGLPTGSACVGTVR
jgi:hypothetical protein